MSAENGFEMADQRRDEDIVLLNHMHPWVLAKIGFLVIILAAITTLSFLIWGASLVSSVTLGASILILVVYLLIRAFIYRNSLLIVTNQRVIYINQKSLFHRTVQEVELENIFNLQYKIKGIMKSLLNFGDIELSTVGDDENNITIQNIENPHFIHEKISELRTKYQKTGTIKNSRTIIR